MNAGDLIQARYELTEPLGSGGMAEVWQAQDRTLGRPVAIKFLAPQLSEDPEFLVRFFAEAQEVARISHPNVVQVLDFGESDESPYLVMECVPGGPLTNRTGEPHEPDWAFEVVAAAARAAGAAHEAGVIHRDIKPGNILLDDHGVAKLADFGISSSGHSERLTATGAAIGSPHYISPEQASGGNASPASDVYALGIVLYELLTGVRPFEGDNITAIAIAHVDQEPAPPSTHVPELGEAIDALVLKCLAKDPAARFADGNELAATLERFADVEGAPIVLADEEVAEGSWWGGRRTLVGIAVAAALLAVPVVAVLASGDGETATAAEESIERLPNVGGLGLKKSPTPSLSPNSDSDGATPRPSPTTRKERAEQRAEDKAAEETAEEGTGPEEEPEPEPTEQEPEPEPTPEPTDGATPAP